MEISKAFLLLVFLPIFFGCCKKEDAIPFQRRKEPGDLSRTSYSYYSSPYQMPKKGRQKFTAYAPLSASMGQKIEIVAFLTDKETTLSFLKKEESSEKIISDQDLLKGIDFELVISPKNSLDKLDERIDDAYRDQEILHKIWVYEVKECGQIHLQFKLVSKSGITLGELSRCIDVSPSWSFFIQSHPFELSTLMISVAALLFTSVDSALKIIACLQRKKIKTRTK